MMSLFPNSVASPCSHLSHSHCQKHLSHPTTSSCLKHVDSPDTFLSWIFSYLTFLVPFPWPRPSLGRCPAPTGLRPTLSSLPRSSHAFYWLKWHIFMIITLKCISFSPYNPLNSKLSFPALQHLLLEDLAHTLKHCISKMGLSIYAPTPTCICILSTCIWAESPPSTSLSPISTCMREATQSCRENTSKGLVGTMPTAYTELGIMSVPTRQGEKPHISCSIG